MAPPKSQPLTDIGWQHGKPVEGHRYQWTCNYCHMHGKGGGVSRLKQHIAGGYPDVRQCDKCGSKIRDAMKAHLCSLKNAKQHVKNNRDYIDRVVSEEGYVAEEGYPNDEEYDDFDQRDPRIPPGEREELRRAQAESLREFEYSQQRNTMQRGGFAQGSSHTPGGSSGSGSGTGSQRGSTRGAFSSLFGRSASMRRTPDIRSVDPHASAPVELTQPRIDDFGKGSKKSKLAKAIGKFFHFNHIPMNAATSPYYRNMIAVAQEVGPGIQPPNPYELAGSLLDDNVKELNIYVDQLKTQWREYGVTIMCDGWTGPTRLKMVNFLISCDGKTVFHESINASKDTQDHRYLKGKMEKVINEVGVNNVVQIVTDNGANYKRAGLSLMADYPNLYWTPCAAHCIDLMMSDIGDLPHVQKLVRRGQTITKFIYNHGPLLAQMREQIGGNLLRPGITRFATNFISLNSIKEKEVGLKALFTGEWWSDSRYRTMSEGKKVEGIILNRHFWTNVTVFIDSVAPLYAVLRKVDSEDVPQMGFIYHLIHNAKAQIQRNNEKGYQAYCNIIENRWENQMGQDIHLAGYYLNPRFQYQQSLGHNNALITALRNVIIRLEPDEMAQAAAIEEGKLFRYQDGSFGEYTAITSRLRMQPSEWWLQFGTSAPHLRKIAVRVLSQAVSSSGCERNWSTFALIHTKSRNRLLAERLNKLVYVSYNMRLRLKHMSKQQQHSDFDFDPTLYGGRDDEDDPIRGWFEAEEDNEMELDQPGDPPRPNEAIARELRVDPNEFAQREFAPIHQGRQPRGDDNLGGSSQHSRRRHRSPTPATSHSSSSSTSDDSNAGEGGHAHDAHDGHGDTFVPSTEPADSDVGDMPVSNRPHKKYARRASEPKESSAGLSRSVSVSSSGPSALQSGWSNFRAGLNAFARFNQPAEDAASAPTSESLPVYQPEIPSQAYSGWSSMQEVPPSTEYRASDHLLPTEPSYSSWDMQPPTSRSAQYVMDSYADSSSYRARQYYDDYIREYHLSYNWDGWVYYVYISYGVDLTAEGFRDPFYEPHRHSMW